MDQVVVNIDNETLLRAAKLWTAHSSTDHLIIENSARGWAANDHRSDLWSIKSRCEDPVIAENLNFAMSKRIDKMTPGSIPSIGRNASCFTPIAPKQYSQRLCVLDGTAKEKHGPIAFETQHCLKQLAVAILFLRKLN
jgi:hypothetical protein